METETTPETETPEVQPTPADPGDLPQPEPTPDDPDQEEPEE